MEEQTEEQVTEEVKVETKDIIQGAEDAADRLERANKRKAELLDREESLMARQALSGRTEGGTVEEKPKVLTDVEYADAMEKGEVDPFKEDGFK